MSENERRDLAARLRSLRQERGISVSELARRAKLSKGYVSQLEREGTHNPSVEALQGIATALGLSMPEVLGARSEPPTGLPKGLEEFVARAAGQGRYLAAEDVEMLLSIRYRGRQPETEADWAYLFETIQRVVKV